MALAKEEEDIEIPPSQPESGLPILAHKLWVGNIDKRITELVSLRFTNWARDTQLQETAREDPIGTWED